MNALVIDDAKAMRLILGRVLNALGFEVSEAGNGREGIETLRQSPGVDLALVDFYMPDMDGVEFVRAVRSESAFQQVRLLLVTSEDDPARIGLALQAGADGYLQKPFAQNDVLNKIRELGFAPSCS